MEDVSEISLKRFLNTFKESCDNGERYCFILGSGASKESGIRTGVELAEMWYNELQEMYSKIELEELMKKLNIDDISVSSKNYFDIYDLRFHPEYKNGNAYIERIMENAQPSYGYYPLAMQLAYTGNNLVITTNFDTMAEDSLFIYTDKRPVVVGHELLAQYINYNSKRPIIAKIHRGLYFKPFNRRTELTCLSEKWKEVLKAAFNIYTPIVIGYAGGDNSLMDFIKDDCVDMRGLYWCYYKKDKLSEEIKGLVKNKKGYFISIDGFDSMMFSLTEKFSYEDPSKHIMQAAESRIKMFQDKYAEFSDKAKSIRNPDASETELVEKLETASDMAIESLKKRIIENPKDRNAYLSLAYQYYLIKNYLETINNCTKAIELQPENANTYNTRGAAYSNIDEYDKAISDYNKAIELKPDYAELFSNRGIIYINMGEYEKSIADFKKAIELKPDNGNAYNDLGATYYKMKEYNKSISDYNKAIELKPDYAEAYVNRGMCYRKIEEYEKSISDYNKAIELKPDIAEAYNSRGITYDNMKEYEKAISDYSKAIELKSDYEEAYNNRGFVYYHKKEFEKAIKDINKALELNPDLAEAYNSRGITYDNMKEYEKAISDYSKAIELKSDYEEAYNNRGFVYYHKKEFEKAIKDINKALELNPEDAFAYDSRGCVYKDLKEYDKALSDYNKAIELKPYLEETYRNRAEVYEVLGEKEKAKDDIEKAETLSKANSD